jgi:hypothetical protein
MKLYTISQTPGVYLDLVADGTTLQLRVQKATTRPPINGVEL